MDNGSVIKYLTGRFGSCAIQANYYNEIATWYEWYRGKVPAFHTRKFSNGITAPTVDIFALKMAKRVCEDWASSLLNESVGITISSGDRSKASSIFIQGEKLNGGVLGSNNFNVEMNSAIEKMFALGTSAIIISLDNIATDADGNIVSSVNGEIKLKFYDATCIVPLSSENGIIKEASFLSEFRNNGKTYYTLSTHKLEADGYVIYNELLNSSYNKVPLSNGVLPVIRTKSFTPMFFIIKPNIANNLDMSSPLGLSVYSDAIDILKAVDETYNACITDVKTGQRMVFMNKKLLTTDDVGRPIVPQDTKQSYFQFFGDDVSDVKEYIKDFSPTIRSEQLDKELQNQLNMLSFKCGLGTKYYSFSNGVVAVTATEYAGSQNDFIRNAKKHSRMLETAMKNLVVQLLWVGKEVLGRNVNPKSKIDIKVSDGIIEDDSKEKESDRQDVKDGIMSKAEYRSKWYGETLEEAQSKVDSIK